MRKNAIIAGALGLASLMGMGQVAQSKLNESAARSESSTPLKATRERKVSPYQKQIEVVGIPLIHHMPAYGMSPKEYGMRYGNGGSKRSKRLRYSHNAKLKKRMAI
jgi:hypothetical protein